MRKILLTICLILLTTLLPNIAFGYSYEPEIVNIEKNDAYHYHLTEHGNIYSLANSLIDSRQFIGFLYENKTLEGIIKVTVPKTSIQIKSPSNVVLFSDENFGYLIVDTSESRNNKIISFLTANKKYFYHIDNYEYLEITFYGEQSLELEIIGPKEHFVNLTDQFEESHFRETLIAKSNILGDITDQIVLINDTYSKNRDTPGVYYLDYMVSDPRGNTTTYKVRIIVYDNVPPKIIDNTNPIRISNRQSFDVAEYLNSLTVTDNYCKSCTITLIEDNYSENKTTPGLYYLIIEAVDSNQNKTIYLKPIEVVESTKQLNTIYVYSNQILTTDQIIRESFGNPINVTIIKNEYQSNENKPGNYLIVFNDDSEQGYDYQIFVRVVNQTLTNEAKPQQNSNIIVPLLSINLVVLCGLIVFIVIKRTKVK